MPTHIIVLLTISAVVVCALFVVLGIVVKKGGSNSVKRILLALITLILLFAVGYICSREGTNPTDIFALVILMGILIACVYYVLKGKSKNIGKKANTSKEQPSKFLSKQKILIIILIAIVFSVIAVVIVLLSQDKKVELGDIGASSIKQIIGQVERSKNKEMTATDTHYCLDFKYFATQWDKNANWFSDSYCNKGSLMYADVATTQKTVVVKIFDGTHVAKYTFDTDIKYLLDYTFEPSTEKGYGVVIYELKDLVK